MKENYQKLRAIEAEEDSAKIERLEKIVEQIMRDLLKVNAQINSLKGASE